MLSRKGGIHCKWWFLSGTDASPPLSVWSTALIVREERKSLLFLCQHGPEIIPEVRRRETGSAAVTVTEVLSWGRGGGGPAAGRSDPECGCSRGGHSGSGGPRVERDQGNSDALEGER